MELLYACITVLLLAGAAILAGLSNGGTILAVTFVPYAAFAIFLAGLCWRVSLWARSPVPFRIPTTCGQQKSLPWIKRAALDNPSSVPGVLGRMVLEVLLFRSLFRNNRAELDVNRYLFGESKLLWLGGMAFHFSLLILLTRHLRLFIQPIPWPVTFLARIDGFFQIGAPAFYMTNAVVFFALIYLLARRWSDLRLRYISQFSDYFALVLLLGIALTGMLMRYVSKVDLVAVKQLALGLATFNPVVPEGITTLVLIHLMLVSALAIYFPFSKLVHMGGIFLSPTRNLANNSRMKRHVNPWNYPVKTHPYPEWEEEFRDKIKMAGIPLDEATNGRSTSAD